MTDAISDFLQNIARGQQAVLDSRVRVEWRDDADRPGLRAYKLSGARKDCIRAKICELMDIVDAVTGEAHFIGPSPAKDGQPGYEAAGVVIKYDVVPA